MEFKLSEEGIRKVRTRTTVSGAKSFVFLMLILAMGEFAGDQQLLSYFPIRELAMYVVFFASLQAWVVYRTVSSARTLVLEIQGNTIRRTQRAFPEIVMDKGELTSIAFGQDGFYRLSSAKGHKLNIPPEMENEAEMRARLQALMPIVEEDIAFWKKHAKTAFRLLMLAYFYFYYTYRHTQIAYMMEWILYGVMCIAAVLGLQFTADSKMAKVALWMLFAYGAGNLLVQLLRLLNQ